jgi:hypothetical protein
VQVFGLMMVRNEADILRVNLRHHLALGIDQFLIVDNGSSDGTVEILEELSRDTGRVRWTRDPGPYRQAEITTGLAHEAYLSGADWVVPIDADEFWHAPGGDLRAVLERAAAGALEVQVINFVQRREQLKASPDALLHMTRRVPRPIGPFERIVELVETRQIGYVQMLYPPKYITRSAATLEIGMGNHTLNGVPGPRQATDEIVCLHAPLRARSALEAKMVDHGRRAEDIALPPGQWWHAVRWRRLWEQGQLEGEWRANSYEDDCLDVYGVPHRLVYDPRLRDIVATWIDRPAPRNIAPSPNAPATPSVGRQSDQAERAALLSTIHEQYTAHLRAIQHSTDEWRAETSRRDVLIGDLQAELHAKVDERDREIGRLETELRTKVGEANRVLAHLQAERDQVIGSLQAQLAAIEGSRVWRIASAYRRLRERLRAGVGNLRSWRLPRPEGVEGPGPR